MRLLQIISGICCLGLGLLLLIPLSLAGWMIFQESKEHTDFLMSVNFGSLTFDGWQMYVALAVILLIAAIFASFGIFLLMARKSEN
ncbi:MAG: hypothetical protein ABJC04_13815 [Verrucomicrobiota bacterium]